jgi:hypothetical protein
VFGTGADAFALQVPDFWNLRLLGVTIKSTGMASDVRSFIGPVISTTVIATNFLLPSGFAH